MVVRLAIVFGMLGLFQATLGPLIPLLRDRDDLSPATAGLLVTGFFGGCLVSTAVGGALTDRWARGPLYVVSSVLLLVGLGLLALPTAWPWPPLAVAVGGLGFGGLVLIVNTVMATRGLTYVNLVNGTYGLGAAAGPALISLTHGGVLFAVLAAGILVSLPWTVPETAPVAEAGMTTERERLRLSLPLVLFCAMLFCYAGVETGLSSWEATHLRAHGYSANTAAALTSLFWLGLAGGRLLVPLVTRNWSPPRLIVTALLACGAGLSVIAFAFSAPAGFLLLGVCVGPIFPATLAWIARTLPHPRRVNAAVLTVAMLGNAAVPALIGYGLQATSVLALPLFVAVALAGCLGIAVALRAKARERQGVSQGTV
ncbi:MFS transporter [Actinophytocola algeriensis]|uniref:Fucose permease n=1 Tax=Actinophytocola algeriensis TaxID=1768010 RepID=A0A7W7Q6K1_9PSEU|nr:MFS transporter [Actinophytocola algeriensis]MBB4907899.1 fucose permease [Actinophytocola algeriensis]MBE1479929.1 fucose permease [Actinophytocola algeriensis]